VTRAIAALLVVALNGVAGASGSSVFNANCAACHQLSGEGVPGVYPPLKDAVGNYVRVPEGRAYLAHVVSFGMTGVIASQGKTYSGFMQAWTQLGDADVADVLNYILLELNASRLPKGFVPFTPGEVKTLRAQRLTLQAVRSEREALMKTLAANADAAPAPHQ
jgi:mono/diheme cytochrome c family protein